MSETKEVPALKKELEVGDPPDLDEFPDRIRLLNELLVTAIAIQQRLPQQSVELVEQLQFCQQLLVEQKRRLALGVDPVQGNASPPVDPPATTPPPAAAPPPATTPPSAAATPPPATAGGTKKKKQPSKKVG